MPLKIDRNCSLSCSSLTALSALAVGISRAPNLSAQIVVMIGLLQALLKLEQGGFLKI